MVTQTSLILVTLLTYEFVWGQDKYQQASENVGPTKDAIGEKLGQAQGYVQVCLNALPSGRCNLDEFIEDLLGVAVQNLVSFPAVSYQLF